MTSIEFLKTEYIKRGDCLPSGVFEEAKEMHKKEIINAHNQSWHDRYNAYKTAENYYKETFKKD